ncbi:MAG: maleylacetate reductase [Gammaproteobacteria bacterium]
MFTFTYEQLPGRVVFGPGKLASINDEIERLGGNRILVVTTPEQQEQGEQLRALIKDRFTTAFNRAAMHVPVEIANEAREAAQEAGIDCVISIGGGSTTGLAKALRLHLDLEHIAIPTTYAGSEMTPVWGLTEDGIKTTGRDLRVLPSTVIYDVDLTLSLPPAIAGPSGINAIAHCVEALYSPNANPVTSLIAEEGIRALSRNLPQVINELDNREARAQTQYGAWLAACAMAAVGMALHHKLCHTLGGSFGLPHAETHTIILPYATRYNAEAAPEAMARIRRAMNTDDAAGGLYDLNRAIGASVALRDLGFQEKDIDRAAELATQKAYPNPAPITYEGIRALLKDAWEGTRPS